MWENENSECEAIRDYMYILLCFSFSMLNEITYRNEILILPQTCVSIYTICLLYYVYVFHFIYNQKLYDS